ncbi:MAG: IS3 family transposase [Verrucomicrobiales bacterium]|nr:IS3 family transposase [Verrucomicrobiales bacterium]
MKVVHNEGFKRACGSPRMTIEWQRRGLSCSENRVARLMSKAGMKARYQTAFRPKTTVQNPARLPAPNRLSKAPAPVPPGEVLVSDITYVATTQGWMYLALTLDLFSRQVAGWHLAQSMETALVIHAARKARSFSTYRLSPSLNWTTNRGWIGRGNSTSTKRTSWQTTR